MCYTTLHMRSAVLNVWSLPDFRTVSWLVKLNKKLTYVRMRPAAIALNYSVKDNYMERRTPDNNKNRN